MAGYTCTKCGETAYSKCVGQRNVFPEHQMATLIGNFFTYGRHPGYENSYVPVLNISLHGAGYPLKRDGKEVPAPRTFAEQRKLEEETALEILRDIGKTSEDVLKMALCDHEWRMDSERCDLGCCRKK